MSQPEEMFQCQMMNCGFIYDPDKGDRKGKIPKNTDFDDLPDDWCCPVCGASKDAFRPLAGPGSVHAENAVKPGQPAAAAKKAKQYKCKLCGYVYDGDTPFEELPDSYECPICGAAKSYFKEV